MGDNLKLALIIPVRNAPRDLKRCLSAARESVAEFEGRGGQVRLIVVDDASTDDTPAVADQAGAQVMHMEPPAKGPAFARNRGSEEAGDADVLVFADSDVLLKKNSLCMISDLLSSRPDVDALFGSYDDQPTDPGFVSQYKNLFHHYVHQTSMENSSSFWAGCGAIRAEVFKKVGGFPESYSRPAIEDIELGYNLMSSGYHTILAKELQVTHLKKWTLYSLVKTDIFMRGVPWTVLLMKTRMFTKDLNLQTHNRVSVVLVYLALLSVLLALFWPWMLASIPPLLGFFLYLNWGLNQFFIEKRGFGFALKAFPMHLLYYFYNGISFWLGILSYQLNKSRDVS